MDCIGGLIESHIGLALVGVLAVAVEAILRKDRSDIPIEVDRIGVLGYQIRRSTELKEQGGKQDRNKTKR
jgi:hypothetical protein